MDILVITALAVLGLLMGSFAGASVWRLRARQLVEDKKAGEKVDSAAYKQLAPLTKTTRLGDRSRCLHCQHQLAWYDLVPLVSWTLLGGKCRYCKARIGWLEPMIELGMAVFFIVSYIVWPQPVSTGDWALMVMWYIVGAGLIVLFVYDMKWFLLPDRVTFPLIAVAVLYALLIVSTSVYPLESALSAVGAVGILSGLYLLLYIVSRGAWIGFGDIKLGLVLGLMLADWQLALLALLLANIIGCLIVLPGMATKRLTRSSHVPFGPMLIAGFWIAGLFGSQIIHWYLSLLSLNV